MTENEFNELDVIERRNSFSGGTTKVVFSHDWARLLEWAKELRTKERQSRKRVVNHRKRIGLQA
jgi:hypothetical protein